ncbi:rifampicin phosphotransferase-like [Centruroides vittatus]|uniref:rifampicin phosphotransferase-like n=1 Tax=Centruroides vittatus TaxID=120091 RepID=UPI00350FFBAB
MSSIADLSCNAEFWSRCTTRDFYKLMEDDFLEITHSYCFTSGIPVSCGRVKGPARVILNVEEAVDIRPGDILITYSTDIGWSPYFPLLAGVVTEIGGLVSHGAVVAREYGLPSVVAAHGAINLLKTGDVVVLNGDKGTICKVKEADVVNGEELL